MTIGDAVRPRFWVGQQFGEAMSQALTLADTAGSRGEIPIGAVVVDENAQVIGRGGNRREVATDPTAHAEILALRQAALRRGSWRLAGCTLVVTVEPCTMCAGAAILARLDRIVFGAWEPKTGACGSVRDVVRDTRLNHQCEVIGGLEQERAASLMAEFFVTRRM